MKTNIAWRKLKSGFTLVELVIVIAVIAILAAVLIPTFITVVDNANNSADVQLVANMNTVLSTKYDADATATAENLRKLMKDNGITEFTTKKEDNVVLYNKEKKKFELVNLSKQEINSAEEAAVDGPVSIGKVTNLADVNGFVLDKLENIYSPEEIFKGYIITSTGGNPLSEALYKLHNLPGIDKGNEKASKTERNEVIQNAIKSLDSVPQGSDVKEAVIGAVNASYYVDLNGEVAKFYIDNEGGCEGLDGERRGSL